MPAGLGSRRILHSDSNPIFFTSAILFNEAITSSYILREFDGVSVSHVIRSFTF